MFRTVTVTRNTKLWLRMDPYTRDYGPQKKVKDKRSRPHLAALANAPRSHGGLFRFAICTSSQSSHCFRRSFNQASQIMTIVCFREIWLPLVPRGYFNCPLLRTYYLYITTRCPYRPRLFGPKNRWKLYTWCSKVSPRLQEVIIHSFFGN